MMKASRVHRYFVLISLCVALTAPAWAFSEPPIGTSLEAEEIFDPTAEQTTELRGGGSSSGDPWPEGVEPIPRALQKMLERLRDGMHAAGHVSTTPMRGAWLRRSALVLGDAIADRDARELEERSPRGRRVYSRAR
jgi:hypothetical protein